MIIIEELQIPLSCKNKKSEFVILENEIEDLGFILRIPVVADTLEELKSEDCFLFIDEAMKKRKIKISYNVYERNYFPVDEKGNPVTIKNSKDMDRIKRWKAVITAFVES